MGVINKTTEKINELLDKIEDAPDKIENGKTPVFVAGTTTTLDPGMSATAEVVLVGTDPEGNPQYKINIGVPKGHDGTGGGGGGVADSVQWTNVLNKPGWVNSATKPTYTASEVGALPEGTKIPTKTSDLTNDKGFLTSSGFKTINGESIVGTGNISLSGTGGISDAPKDGKTYGRNNGSWVETSQMGEAPSDGNAYARKNKGWTKVIESTETALLDNYAKLASYSSIEPTDSINEAIGKLEAGIGNQGGGTSSGVYLLNSKLLSLKSTSTSEEIIEAFGGLEETAKVSQAIIDGKQFFIQKKTSSFDKSMTPVSVYGYLNSIIYLSFIYKTITNERIFNIVVAPSSSIKITEIGGYKLKSELYSLTAESSSDDISVAIGGEDGMKEIIKAIKDGNTFFIEGTLGEAKMKTQILPNMCSESENGDLQVTLTGFGYAMWEGLGGLLLIAYNKASNTFSIQIASITS